MFDTLSISIETLQGTLVYAVYAVSLTTKRVAEPAEVAYAVSVVAEIACLCVTLGHFMYVFFLNGLTLSLVDALVFLNIRGTVVMLLKRCDELRALRFVAALFKLLPATNANDWFILLGHQGAA